MHQRGPVFGVALPIELIDLNASPEDADGKAAEQSAQLEVMSEKYAAWYKDVHTVSTEFSENDRGATLTGADFLRTPGIGGYTFGIGVPHLYEGKIAGQSDIWSIRKTGTRIDAEYG